MDSSLLTDSIERELRRGVWSSACAENDLSTAADEATLLIVSFHKEYNWGQLQELNWKYCVVVIPILDFQSLRKMFTSAATLLARTSALSLIEKSVWSKSDLLAKTLNASWRILFTRSWISFEEVFTSRGVSVKRVNSSSGRWRKSRNARRRSSSTYPNLG